MNQYKFKIWDKMKQRFLNYEVMTIDRNGELNHCAEDCFIYSGYNHRLLLLFYSPFFDKNGKQICEGDIVQVTVSYTVPVLDYGQGPTEKVYPFYKIIYNCSTGMFDLIEISDIGEEFNNLYQAIDECEIEIIGNIYENPGLLGESHES